MHKNSLHTQFAGMAGNFLEHYDSALFGLLAPYLAPLFFENKDPVTALILTYSMLPLGFFIRPLGSLLFGRIGDRFGRKQALCLSLLGMGAATTLIGSLPLYADIGIMAPILLAIARLLQSFFASGESIGGAIFVLENTEEKKRSVQSSLYDASTIAGILLASMLVLLLTQLQLVDGYWRLLFLGGAVTAISGLYLRLRTHEGEEFVQDRISENRPIFPELMQHKKAVIALVLISGLSYTTYSLPFVFMNGFVPLISSLTKDDLLFANTLLLVLDMALLPLFGALASRIGKEKQMFFVALFLSIIALPLFALLQNASLSTVILVRLVIVISGVAFAAPYHAFALEQVPPHCRYTLLSFSYALGSQLIGTPSSAASLYLYQKTGWVLAPGIYLLTTSLLACTAFLLLKQKTLLTAGSPLKNQT